MHPAPTVVSGNHPYLQLAGRFHATDTGALRCAWSGSQITLRFEGTGIDATFRDLAEGGEGNFLALLLDDARPTTLALKPGLATYRLAENLAAGEHTLRLFKQTEASVGRIEFEKFALQNGTVLPPPPKSERRMELIGDSITCGYGNEASGGADPFKPSTENHYLSYGQLAARALRAECHTVACSGEGILRNAVGDVVHPIPSIYGQILPPTLEPAWDFAQWIPRVVVINLGTNDFLIGIPDRETFICTYLALIDKLHRFYHSPIFFCCLSPMITDESPQGENQRATARTYLQEIKDRAEKAGIQSLHMLEFKTLQPGEFGADWHPNLVAHRRMARTLTGAIRQGTGW